MYKIECDTHTHTLFSRHAYSTIQENVMAAKEAGLKLLGSTDHFSEMLFPDYENIKNYQYLLCTHMWPRNWDGVTVLKGCEADIVDLDGNMFGHDISVYKATIGDIYDTPRNLQQMVFGCCDYVIASIHSKRHTIGASLSQTTNMYIKALENPKVFFIGHIGRAGVPFEMDEVLKVAKELHKPVEINEHSFGFNDDNESICSNVAERCAELGVGICVNTDAHISLDIGKVDKTKEILENIHFPEELIVNRTAESFLKGLEESGVFTLNK
ncbi:phosphatase [Butyrivibrio proteoclasticus]|uniref:phosphatase n=1 Tax=Butyrivibrio proteoclasticus TaxID=43305 RepID=UPI00047D75D1|nr:phosphatase [Butyrivibrio proteoclasticus]